MMRRRLAAALAAGALIASLTGCATPGFDEATASQLQQSVIEVAEAASAGDNAGAITHLDELQAQLDDAIAGDLITAARAARVQTAIDLVRADLDALVAPAPEPTPSPSEAEDTGGDDKGGGGNDNSGPGNNNGNGGKGKGKDKDD